MSESTTSSSTTGGIYFTEYAVSGRSGCREFRCGQKIPKDQVRIGLAYSYGESGGYHWYHPQCLWKTFRYKKNGNPKIMTLAEIGGLQNLEPEDQQIFQDLIDNEHNNNSTPKSNNKKKRGTPPTSSSDDDDDDDEYVSEEEEEGKSKKKKKRNNTKHDKNHKNNKKKKRAREPSSSDDDDDDDDDDEDYVDEEEEKSSKKKKNNKKKRAAPAASDDNEDDDDVEEEENSNKKKKKKPNTKTTTAFLEQLKAAYLEKQQQQKEKENKEDDASSMEGEEEATTTPTTTTTTAAMIVSSPESNNSNNNNINNQQVSLTPEQKHHEKAIHLYGLYHKMLLPELKDYLRWNRQIMKGTKPIVLHKVIDGHLNGRLACCPHEGCGGKLKLNDDCTAVHCQGYFDEDLMAYLPCVAKDNPTIYTIEEAPRIHPWYTRKPTDLEDKAMDLLEATSVGEQAKYATTNDGTNVGKWMKLANDTLTKSKLDLSNKKSIQESAQQMITFIQQHTNIIKEYLVKSTTTTKEDDADTMKTLKEAVIKIMINNKERAAEPSEWIKLLVMDLVKAAKIAKHTETNGATTPTYLNCPYKEKDEAKALGARWDPEEKKWYVPPGKDLTKFTKWLPKKEKEEKEQKKEDKKEKGKEGTKKKTNNKRKKTKGDE